MRSISHCRFSQWQMKGNIPAPLAARAQAQNLDWAKDTFWPGNWNWNAKKEAKLEQVVVSYSSRGVQGQCPVVAMMTYSAKQCLTAAGATCHGCSSVQHWWHVVLVRLLLLPGFQTLFESCLFVKSTSSSTHELQKVSYIPEESGAVACNQGVWLVHHSSPWEPSLRPGSSFYVDPA